MDNEYKDDNDEILNYISSCTDNVKVMKLLNERLSIGRSRYGHGIIIDSDTSQWTENKRNDWLEMAYEEFFDGILYLVSARIRFIRKNIKDPEYVEKIDKSLDLLIKATEIFLD
jgi:hypothetical protein